MSNRKMIQSNLIKNSIAAYFAAIEIHNKPNIPYRYETVTLLIINAWELCLKCFIRKYVKDKTIFTETKHTITLDKSLIYVDEYFNKIKDDSFKSIKKNIEEIELYRNEIMHFYSEKLEPYIFMLVAKAATNYVEFVKTFFDRDIMNVDGLFILPLGFKLPFKPEEFLTKKSIDNALTKESKYFIQTIVKSINELKSEGIEDSIVLGFDIYFESVKKSSNSDLIAAITKIEDADATFTKVTHVRLSSDPSAQVMNMSDEEFRNVWKYTHKEIVEICRNQIQNFKQNAKFNEIMKNLEKDIKCVYRRRLDIKNPKSASKPFYTEIAILKIKEAYAKLDSEFK